MSSNPSGLLEILRENVGFTEPERWLSIAAAQQFQRVRACALAACPDCDGPFGDPIGQYVYYSTLMRLRPCRACGLITSDVRLDTAVLFGHFQRQYKDETYFVEARAAIFAHLADRIARVLPTGGRVLDIGGAKGHLMAALQTRRPDAGITVNDLSPDACRHAAEVYGFHVVSGEPTTVQGRYDVVVVSDALYYVAPLRETWDALARVVLPGGTLLLRLPNKAALIRAAGWATRDPLRLTIQGFNPEHLHLFTRPYLRRRLTGLGFTHVRVLGSPALGVGRLARLTHWLGPVALTPSVLVTARRATKSHESPRPTAPPLAP